MIIILVKFHSAIEYPPRNTGLKNKKKLDSVIHNYVPFEYFSILSIQSMPIQLHKLSTLAKEILW